MSETTNTDAVRDFCWSVIYDLRQPMTAISGHTQRAQLLVATDPSGARHAMDEVLKQIARIDRLLVDLYERERRAPNTTELDVPWGDRPAREGVKT